MVVKCSGPKFDNLKNPFTGEKMHVQMSISASGVMKFFAPDEYSPNKYFKTAEEAFRMYDRVDGVEGLKRGKMIVCPYTGDPLTLVHNELGYHYTGGFVPSMMHDRDWFLYYASMRNGKSEYPKPKGPAPRVEKVKRAQITKGMRKHAAEMKTELTQQGIETAESVMKEIDSKFGLEKSSTVSMHGATK